jgi:hypothetical protein
LLKPLAFLIGMAVCAVGLAGAAVPGVLVAVARQFRTAPAFLALAVVRVAVGLVLFAVAPTSRLPRSLRGLGVVVVIAGIATAAAGLFAMGPARAAIDWWFSWSPWLLRLTGTALAALGGFIAYACAPARHAA